MKDFFDKLFDYTLPLFIIITIVCAAALMITAVTLTIRDAQAYTGVVLSAVVMSAAAVAVSYFFIDIYRRKKS